MQAEIPFRIVIHRPPEGVTFAMQRGRSSLVPPSESSAEAMVFDFVLRVGEQADGRPNFLGEFAQGTPADRFVYVNSGTSAGQPGSPWTRRAKLKLATVTREMVDAARADAGAVIEARIEGIGRDGGPACATVPLLDGGWRLVRG